MVHKGYLLNLFDRKEQEALNSGIVFSGEISVSTFTTLAEDAPKAAVLKDITLHDNGVNFVRSA